MRKYYSLLLLLYVLNCYALKCSENNGGCSENALCIEVNYDVITCMCKNGYEGDGINCTQTIFSSNYEDNKNYNKNDWILYTLISIGSIGIIIGIILIIKLKFNKNENKNISNRKISSPRKRPQPELY